MSWQNKAQSACAANVCTWQFPELCPASCCGWSGLECARDMLIYAFERDITSRHNKSTNKCQPVFALMAGFRREGAWGRKNSSREREMGKKKAWSQTHVAWGRWKNEQRHSQSNSVGYWDKYQLLGCSHTRKPCKCFFFFQRSSQEFTGVNFNHITHI